jgi:lipopolysaccharide/colanic/teichoic acid biosynthesis glycosyltransferase
MKRNSENMGAGHITLKNDSRVLPFGKFLRQTKINEIPQLINVLKGEMSIVGPRPHTVETIQYYSLQERSIICSVKPGLTGLGSIFFRDEEAIIGDSSKDHLQCYIEDIQPRKAQLEIWYATNHSFWLDIKIIFSTILVVIFPETKFHFRLINSIKISKDCIRLDQI